MESESPADDIPAMKYERNPEVRSRATVISHAERECVCARVCVRARQTIPTPSRSSLMHQLDAEALRLSVFTSELRNRRPNFLHRKQPIATPAIVQPPRHTSLDNAADLLFGDAPPTSTSSGATAAAGASGSSDTLLQQAIAIDNDNDGGVRMPPAGSKGKKQGHIELVEEDDDDKA
jgi:hypothetical protein